MTTILDPPGWAVSGKRSVTAAAVVLAGFCLASGAAFAQGMPNICKETAVDAKMSCQQGARSDFWIARGVCLNLSDLKAKNDCIKAAMDVRTEALGDCKDQFDARVDVCGDLGRGPYDPVIDPSNFTTTIDNPLFPLVPGTTFTYRTNTSEGVEMDVMTVTDKTKVISGVTCVEVHDAVSLDGVLTEDTLDWYAQDTAGNVWYFGENSLTLENGLVVSVEGSWETGVDGAKPGIIMEASPQVGDEYRQEFALGTAEDLAKVTSLSATETVPFGTFTNLVETNEFEPLEPDASANKFYAAGIGVILEVDLETGERTELLSVTP